MTYTHIHYIYTHNIYIHTYTDTRIHTYIYSFNLLNNLDMGIIIVTLLHLEKQMHG